MPRRIQELAITLAPAGDALAQKLGRTPTRRELAVHLDAAEQDIAVARNPGGGVALANAAATAFDKLDLTGDEATGANIVRVALTAPLKQIAINAGLEGGVVAEKVNSLPPGHGLNAETGQYLDMIKAGIVEHAKVTRSTLQIAASIAALFLTAEAFVAGKPA